MKPDIFDRLMETRRLRQLRPLYRKYKELLLYMLFGVLTFAVSMASYAGGEYLFGMPPLWANVFSWVMAVAFAYVTNRTWVFAYRAETPAGVIREAFTFFSGRLTTLGLEELLLAVGIYALGWSSLLVKAIAQVAVVVSNYFISKLIVFRKRA